MNLDGLAHWSPENAVAVRELVLAYHEVFVVERNELGYTSAIEHEILIKNDEPFKERFWRCGHSGPEKGWYPVVLHGLQAPQCMYEEGLVPPAMDSGGPGKHGEVGTFLIDGFQVRLLADQDGPRIRTVHGLHSGEPWFL